MVYICVDDFEFLRSRSMVCLYVVKQIVLVIDCVIDRGVKKSVTNLDKSLLRSHLRANRPNQYYWAGWKLRKVGVN